MTNEQVSSLSDSELLTETARVADTARRSTVELLALLGEVDRRRLYLGLGYSSTFVYCTQALHLSEAAAYSRITAARAARDFPIILTLMADGGVTLTTVSLLAAHLTDDNHEALLTAASHKTRRDVEHLVACLDPQPDIPSSVRRIPVQRSVSVPALLSHQPDLPAVTSSVATKPTPRALVAPIAADRYLLKVTLSGEAQQKLERARALLRHQIPNGDPASIVERALTVLVEQLERTKLASTRRPKITPTPTATSRHVPAAVKRAVWERDGGRCAFVGADGRCGETGCLEFHHTVPFAAGGRTDVENLQLRCRPHNAYEATLFEQSWPIGDLR